MKKTILQIGFLLFCILWTSSAFAKIIPFSESLCEDARFECLEIQEGENWSSLWEDEKQRDQIRRLNRINIKLRPGMKVAVPKDENFFTDPKNAPFPLQIESTTEKQIRVNLSVLAWAAYNEEGKLLKWGPASGGKAWCPDTKAPCRTPSGEFSLLYKRGASCKSHKFPIPKGGAPMPYCMFFRSGYALHGSPQVPGYNASHGCVRLFTEDAKWLNEEFTKPGETQESTPKIKIILEKYSDIVSPKEKAP